MRRLWSLLLCACIALQGVGAVAASEVPCPMEAEMVAMVAAGELSAEDLPDCCNDMQTWAETGQLCQPSLEGAGVLVWALAPASVTVTPLRGSDLACRAGPTALSAPPGAPWRPPAGA